MCYKKLDNCNYHSVRNHTKKKQARLKLSWYNFIVLKTRKEQILNT